MPHRARQTAPSARGHSSRAEAIVARLKADGRIDVTSLARELGVAQETVRRDLTTLERQGHLVRVHGGAVAPPASAPVATTVSEETDPQFAKAVWAELPRSGTLLLGGGSHCRAVAEAIVADPTGIPGEAGLQVVTYALDIAVLLSRGSGLPVFNLGGIVSPQNHVQVGDWTLAELRRFHVDVAVLSPAGVTPHGLSEQTPAAAAVARAAMSAADQVMVLVDDRTAGKPSYVEFAPTADAHTIWVAGRLETSVLQALGEAGPRIVNPGG